MKKIDLNDIKVEKIIIYSRTKLRKKCFKEYVITACTIIWESSTRKIFILSRKKYRKKHTLCDVKYISRGSYGEVSVHSDSSKKYRIALKTYRNPRDSEFAIIKLLEKKKVNCNLINARIISDLQDSRKITIMNLWMVV